MGHRDQEVANQKSVLTGPAQHTPAIKCVKEFSKTAHRHETTALCCEHTAKDVYVIYYYYKQT